MTHHGTLLYDGTLPGLVSTFSPDKTIVVELEEGASELDERGHVERLIGDTGEIVDQSEIEMTVRVPKADTARVRGELLAALPVADLTVEDPPIEVVIERVFASRDDDDDSDAAPAQSEVEAAV